MDAPQYVAWGLYGVLFLCLAVYGYHYRAWWNSAPIMLWSGMVFIYYSVSQLHALGFLSGFEHGVWSIYLRIMAGVTMLIQLYIVWQIRKAQNGVT